MIILWGYHGSGFGDISASYVRTAELNRIIRAPSLFACRHERTSERLIELEYGPVHWTGVIHRTYTSGRSIRTLLMLLLLFFPVKHATDTLPHGKPSRAGSRAGVQDHFRRTDKPSRLRRSAHGSVQPTSGGGEK